MDNRSKKISTVTATLLAVTFYLRSVIAANYYISTTGSNSNDGSFAHPWATINHAIEHTKAGDTIYMRGGTYREGEVWIRSDYGMGGVSGKYWTLTAYNNEEVILNNPDRPFIIDAPYVRIDGIKFMSKEVSVCTWHGTHDGVQILNCVFTGVFSYGAIDFAGSHGLIKGNRIMIDYTTQGTQGHGIYLMRSSDTIIRNNFISGPTGYCIHVYDEHKSEDPSGYIPVISNVLIDSNFVTNSRERSGIIVAADYTARVKGVTICNNVIVNNAASGISLTVDNGQVEDIKVFNNTISGTGEGSYEGGISVNKNVKSVVIKNNIIVINKNAGFHIKNYGATQNAIVDYNLYWPAPLKLGNVADNHAIVKDPKFVNPSNNDFHLQPDSPAIDAGTDVAIQYLGAAPDIGAFEFNNAPMSVELISFNVQAKDNSALLTWRTASELDNFGFEIERRSLDEDYRKIAFVKGAGSTRLPQGYQYLDKMLSAGRYYYRLRQINLNGTSKLYGEVEVVIAKPYRFNLEQNYPNPFNSETAIAFCIPTDSFVDLSIFNIRGERVATLVHGEQLPGWKTVKWTGVDDSGASVASGSYLYRLAIKENTMIKKMILLE
ncbi:MAG: right-handed parallel beta-helix repeat-containing protein [candidate division KSB1 bacterium]|nr:right-handed parallel beta-helix repeat-containing protein [candidate division KSB1 bacterium]